MHIPENYLSPQSCGVLGAVMVPVWGYALKKTQETLPREKMSLLGIAAAFSFLSMMFNVPIPGGSTGHAVCGTLIAILFGPWPAVLALSMALIVQAIFFGDGGILAIGANCFNMAFVLPIVGFALYSAIAKRAKTLKGELAAAAIASYVALNAAALCASVEFGIQPLLFTDAAGQALYCPYPLGISIPAMMLEHLTVFGFVEAAFTVAILAFVRKTSPNFGISPAQSDQAASKTGIAPLAGLLGVLILATPLGLIAQGDAWGEWGLEDLSAATGFAPQGMANGWEWNSFMPDYSFGALPEAFGYILCAIIGCALLVIVFRLISYCGKPAPQFDSPQ